MAAGRDLREVVVAVARETDLQLSYVRPLGGATEGAHLVEVDGRRLVLKFGDSPPGWLEQLRRAQTTTALLRGSGYPTPELVAVGSLGESSWYCLQEFIEGEAAAPSELSPARVDAVIELLHRHRGMATDTTQDWSVGIVALLFDHDHERAVVDTCAVPAVHDVLHEIDAIVAGLDPSALGHDDLVIGDFGSHNMVFDGDVIRAVVDFQSAGRGDMLLDAAGLCAQYRLQPETAARIRSEFLATASRDALTLVAASLVVRGIWWHLREHAPDLGRRARDGLSLIPFLVDGPRD